MAIAGLVVAFGVVGGAWLTVFAALGLCFLAWCLPRSPQPTAVRAQEGPKSLTNFPYRKPTRSSGLIVRLFSRDKANLDDTPRSEKQMYSGRPSGWVDGGSLLGSKWSILRNRPFRFILSLELLDSFASSELFVFLPLVLLAKGYTIGSSLLLQSFLFLGYLSGRWLVGYLAKRYSGLRAVGYAEVGMVVSIVLLLAASQLWLVYAMSFALGIFARGTSPAIKALAFDSLGSECGMRSDGADSCIIGRRRQSMPVKNWTKLFKDHKGQWVALKDDEVTVISSGRNLPDVILMAANKGYQKPILTKIPQKDVVYIGYS